MPAANVMNATLMLFVMMALDANGLTPTIECVHISRAGGSSRPSPARATFMVKSGSWAVRTAPTAAASQNSDAASRQ